MIPIDCRAMLLVCFTALAISGCSEKKNYSTYEDCILAEVSANQTEAAVVVVRDACRMKFPNPSPSEAQLIAAQDQATADALAADPAQAAADVAAAAADAAVAAAKEHEELQQ